MHQYLIHDIKPSIHQCMNFLFSVKCLHWNQQTFSNLFSNVFRSIIRKIIAQNFIEKYLLFTEKKLVIWCHEHDTYHKILSQLWNHYLKTKVCSKNYLYHSKISKTCFFFSSSSIWRWGCRWLCQWYWWEKWTK